MRTEKQKARRRVTERQRIARNKLVCECGNLMNPQAKTCARCASIKNITKCNCEGLNNAKR